MTTVKQLEWKQAARNGSYLAHGIGILYAVDEDHDGAILAEYSGNSVLKSAHANAEAAESAAFDDYSARIMSAIEPAGVGVETPSPSSHVMTYRLLSEGEIVQKGDQPLNDDCVSWGELAGWEIGIAYYHSVFVPIRRAISTTVAPECETECQYAKEVDMREYSCSPHCQYLLSTPSPQPRVAASLTKEGEQ